jgi:hypothetical protein
MSQTTGLTTISEDDITKHRSLAQSLVTRVIVMEKQDGKSSTPLAGTSRRFVSTVSTSGMRRTREIELGKTIQAIRPDDPDAVDPPAYAAVSDAARPGRCAGGGGDVRPSDGS